MNERYFVEKIQAAIKASPALRGAVIFKHAETLTSGIPDLSVSIRGTSWIEVKYLRRGKRLKDIVKSPLQVITAGKLAFACYGKCWFVVYEDSPKRTVIWRPEALFRHLWPKLGGAYASPSLFFNDSSMTVSEALAFYGVIHVPGHQHNLIAQLIQETSV